MQSAGSPVNRKGNAPKYAKNVGYAQKSEIEVIVWESGKFESILAFSPPFVRICEIQISKDEGLVVFAGKDFQNRDLVMVYDLQKIVKFKQVCVFFWIFVVKCFY